MLGPRHVYKAPLQKTQTLSDRHMWKFCRPDIQDFEAFVKYLISDDQIEIKSVLLNDLCHGGKFSDHPHQETEIVEAATEAVRVVETFARGQLKLCQ